MGAWAANQDHGIRNYPYSLVSHISIRLPRSDFDRFVERDR